MTKLLQPPNPTEITAFRLCAPREAYIWPLHYQNESRRGSLGTPTFGPKCPHVSRNFLWKGRGSLGFGTIPFVLIPRFVSNVTYLLNVPKALYYPEFSELPASRATVAPACSRGTFPDRRLWPQGVRPGVVPGLSSAAPPAASSNLPHGKRQAHNLLMDTYGVFFLSFKITTYCLGVVPSV